MYDGLELCKFERDNSGVLRLVLNKGVSEHWLPYIFEIGIACDMDKVLKTWIIERVFPKNRFGAKEMMKELGIKKYDVNKIAELTRCSLMTDPYWLVYDESDTYTKNSVRGQAGSEKFPYNSLGIVKEEDYIWRI